MKIEEKKKLLTERINSKTKDLKAKAEGFKSLGKDALLIGGVLVFAYSLFNLFSDDKEEEQEKKVAIKKDESQKRSLISRSITGLASSILLAVAKEKLMDYLDNLKTDDEENNPKAQS